MDVPRHTPVRRAVYARKERVNASACRDVFYIAIGTSGCMDTDDGASLTAVQVSVPKCRQCASRCTEHLCILCREV